MSDKLKNYINKNRKQFDDETPSDKVWEGLNEKMKPRTSKTISLRKSIIWAAAAVFFVAVFTIGYQRITIKNLKHSSALDAELANDQVLENSEWQMPDDVKELDKLYQIQVANTMSLLKQHPRTTEEIRGELKELDAEFETLKLELGQEYSQNEVIEAMIENYRYKIELLESTLEHFKRTDQIIQNDSNAIL